MNSRFACICIKAQEQKMTEKWNNLTEKAGSFLFLCLYANRCEPGVHSYQLYNVQSTSSPILKFLGLWGHFGQLGGTLYKSVTVLSNAQKTLIAQIILSFHSTKFLLINRKVFLYIPCLGVGIHICKVLLQNKNCRIYLIIYEQTAINTCIIDTI